MRRPAVINGILQGRGVSVAAGDEVFGGVCHGTGFFGGGIAVGARGGTNQKQIDGGGHRLDVAVFLGGNVGDQVIKGADLGFATKVERLERIVHQRGHLAELATQQFLHSGGGVRIRASGFGEIHRYLIESINHRATDTPGGKALDC